MMAKFLYLYAGGQMAETPEAQEAAMQQWTTWFGTLGDSVVDIGNPFGAGTTVKDGGTSDGGASELSGYSIINAESLAEAASRANGCPVLQSGGTVEVYEALAM
jgi:S1-C subfamily serine protease